MSPNVELDYNESNAVVGFDLPSSSTTVLDYDDNRRNS